MAWNAYDKNCPTRIVLDRIADKWTVLLLGLLSERPYRFNEIRKNLDGVSQKVLTQVLRELERDGVIARTVSITSPVMVHYSITPFGMTLAAVVRTLTAWAETNIETILQSRNAAGEPGRS
ncbi:transcriptional regulator [Alsobacter metallidurans]|uniref:Transcriptional regulator n=1 Tax=Alsobacter metallidurans TaxID=340221 RepID=A0A917I4A4_9HYPH|nr:helix-turn-helix domain-containing protein [Alsobacter metallidurans]GGH11400.1 transcriptional regulator [Alsobacter metallidurans]